MSSFLQWRSIDVRLQSQLHITITTVLIFIVRVEDCRICEISIVKMKVMTFRPVGFIAVVGIDNKGWLIR